MAVRPPICQSLASDALNRESGAGCIIAAELDAMIVPEIELLEVKPKVRLANVVIGAVNARGRGKTRHTR